MQSNKSDLASFYLTKIQELDLYYITLHRLVEEQAKHFVYFKS